MQVRFSAVVLGTLISLCRGLPAPQSAPALLPTPPAPPPSSVIQCTPNQTRMIRLSPPTFQSCAFALRALPSFQDMGTFHAGGTADTFQLPVRQTYGSCTVMVELAGGHQTETGSWMEVGLAANQVNMACVDTNDAPVRMGGWTTGGRANGVVVTIRETS